MNSSPGFGYVFERFPSFTQTFCAREIRQWHQLGAQFPIYALRSVDEEGLRHFPAELYEETQVVPDVDRLAKRWWTPFSFHARTCKGRLYERWGREGGRRRALEAAWLGPRLLAAGVRHVHSHFAGRAARTAFWLKQCHGISFSFTAHANDFFVDAPGLFLEDLFGEAEFVVTVSDFSARQLAESFPQAAQKIHRVYNGIDVEAFARDLSKPAQPSLGEPPLILSVGRYIEKKGFPDLIAACGLLGDLDFRCMLVGEGPMEEELRQEVARLGLEGKVEIAGPKTEPEIRELLAKSRVFALACCREKDGGMDNLPTVIMEAMAAGLPVVSTLIAGVPEMVLEQQTGALVSEHDAPALAEALRAFLTDAGRAAEFGRQGREIARERFDIGVTSRELLRTFQRHGIAKSIPLPSESANP